jgi:molecular chaperone GrpE
MDTVNLSHGVDTEEAQRPEEAAEPEAAVRPAPANEELSADRDRLAREKSELQDLLQRRQAEFENFRKRSERERSEVFEFAAMDTVKSLLPILDDFERALKTETTDREYARGMELIYNRLLETLKKLGLEPIGNEVKLFNPHIHHAVEMVDTKDHPDQTVLEEYQKGYYFRGRLLRPAMVKVAVNH